MLRRALALIVVFLVGACATPIVVVDAGTPCEASSFTVLDDFGGARRGRCEVLANNHVRLSIVPEDDGYINPSPWFAFKLVPTAEVKAIVSLQYLGGHHRYVPKTSSDGLNWSPIDASQAEISADTTVATFTVSLENDAVWVSAQELLMPAAYDAWAVEIASQTDAERLLLGYSIGKRSIHYLVTDPSANNVLLLVGRQHPPEVSGAFAFFSFVETLLGDTELAARFREHFQIVAIPLMNPDGVLAGHWRHNLGSTDINRDWGIFNQPETRLVGELLEKLDSEGRRVRVFLDFHSTKRNAFYVQDHSEPTDPPNFFAAWFERATPRLDDYRFTYEPRFGEHPGVGKNYMYRRYGIPSATYEVGDETDREATRRAAVVFAEELMQLMLETLAEARR